MKTNKEKLRAIVRAHLEQAKHNISASMKAYIGNDDWRKARSIEVYELVLMNIYYSAIDWVSEEANKDLAWIRPDIIEKGLAVPVGEVFYGSDKPLPYRWTGFDEDDKDVFEVCYCGEWVEAQSIDWDFTDALIQEKEEARKFVEGVTK